jgi:hypothetical protein
VAEWAVKALLAMMATLMVATRKVSVAVLV